MIKKEFSKNSNKKRVLSNVFSLFFIQGIDYLLPLLLFPYLVHVLGIKIFGLLAFSTATVAFLGGVVSYGFDLSGTQQISINRKNNFKIIEIFNSIMLAKFILLIVSFIVLLLLITFVDKIAMHWEIFIATFLLVLGESIFPTWFFLGIEKMKLITYFRIFYKGIYIVSIFIFVKSTDDYLLVPILNGIGSILTGIGALILVRVNFKVKFELQKISNIVFQFKNSWHIFISQIAVHFYSSINIFVLGMMTTNTDVGYYSLAHKVYHAIRGLLKPINQGLFPFLAKKYTKNKIAYYAIIKKISLFYSIALSFLAFFLLWFSQDIIKLVSGTIIPESIELLHIFSITMIFAIGSFYSSLLIIKSQSRVLSKITFLAMVLNLTFLYPVINFYGIFGLAYLILMVQAFQAFLQIKYNYEIWR